MLFKNNSSKMGNLNPSFSIRAIYGLLYFRGESKRYSLQAQYKQGQKGRASFASLTGNGGAIISPAQFKNNRGQQFSGDIAQVLLWLYGAGPFLKSNHEPWKNR